MVGWIIGEVDALIESTLANDTIIKQKMGISSGKARVAGYRIPRDPFMDSAHPFYIFFYSIPGPSSRVNGNTIIQRNPDYDIEVRSLGAATDDAEACVDRVETLIGAWKNQVTPSGNYLVSAVSVKEISITQPGETTEVYYERKGFTYKLAVVHS